MERCINCHRYLCNCNHPNDLFGTPFCCQNRKRTRRFTSPNSPLDEEELNQLQACIEAANDLLRSLGSESDNENTRQLQLHFLDMSGKKVSAEIICKFKNHEADEFSKNSSKAISLKGKIANAGKDFLQINQNGSSVFIFYKNLLAIKRDNSSEGFDEESEFIDANQNLRRTLAFNFGEFVSKNPNLVNLFFGIPLYKMLKQYLGKDVDIFTKEKKFLGTLTKVEEGNVKIFEKDRERNIAIDEICFLKVLNLK